MGDVSLRTWLFRCCWLLLGIDALLGVAHLLWPDYHWGQTRSSYFNLQHAQTPASWLAGMQLAAAAGFAGVAFRRERARRARGAWSWLVIAAVALLWSLTEVTRDHGRRGMVALAATDPFQLLLVVAVAAVALATLGGLVLGQVAALGVTRRWAVAWLALWGGALVVAVAAAVDPPVTDAMRHAIGFLTGLGFLAGTTAFLAAIAGHATSPIVEATATTSAGSRAHEPPPMRLPRKGEPWPAARAWLLVGVFGTTFAVIVLQSLLLRALGIFGDYVTAHGVISIALLGVAAGALVGYGAVTRGSAHPAALGASLLFPASILTTYGAIVAFGAGSLVTSLLLAVPFLLASVAVAAVLVLDESHRVYFVDLLGAAVGALAIGPALDQFREEGSLLLLAAVAFLPAWAFSRAHPARRVRRAVGSVCMTGAALVGWLGVANGERDWFNLVREQARARYPEAALLYSRSSLAGRYDVIRRWRDAQSISAFENGWVTDTIRPRPPAEYRIDPRLPHNLIEDPVVLILGLSGDGITKTARAIGTKVYGVEINPAVVALQTGALVEHNGAAYDGIEVSVGDGRTFVETSARRYDIITLMNAHAARGLAEGRGPSPEYLHTREAIDAYLDHLTERGVVIVEEPVSTPWREVPVWKLLWTMRAVLLERGAADPARHFVVFQWRTPTNRYLQILMKKTPFAADELGRVRGWLDECDRRRELEAAAGRRLGPITTRTTLLHAPDEPTGSNVSRVVRGDVAEGFLRARGLEVITDDRPFYFDVDPERAALRDAYARTGLLLVVVLLPLGLVCVPRPGRAEPHHGLFRALPQAQIAVLSGIAYLLIEMVLLQRYTIFLGSALATFTTVLGTMLTCSGLGSLWSGRLGERGARRVAAAILVLIGAQALLVPWVFTVAAALSLAGRVIVAAAVLAPLALAMGVPFPYAMRAAQRPAGRSAAALLFALNAAAGALAVPLAMSLGTRWGLAAVLAIAGIAYAAVGALIGAHEEGRLRLTANVAAAALIGLLLAIPMVPMTPTMPSFRGLSAMPVKPAMPVKSVEPEMPMTSMMPTMPTMQNLPASPGPPVSADFPALSISATSTGAPAPSAMPTAGASSGARASDGGALWQVYAARYGHSRVGADRIFADGAAEQVRPFGWFFWIVRGGGRTILVDTGFDDARQARDWDITGYVRPTERLATLGIEPDDVTDIVLTHAHWDHMGGIGAYPRARIHIQDAEYRHALGSVGVGRPRRHGIRWQDVRALRAAEAAGRLVRVDGDAEPFPGVRLVAGGGHTPGSQWVEVATIDGIVVIAGDAVTQDENNAWHRAIAGVADPAANLAALRRMQTRAASLFLIVPGHDPDTEAWFPQVAPGVVEVTARARPDGAGRGNDAPLGATAGASGIAGKHASRHETESRPALRERGAGESDPGVERPFGESAAHGDRAAAESVVDAAPASSEAGGLDAAQSPAAAGDGIWFGDLGRPLPQDLLADGASGMARLLRRTLARPGAEHHALPTSLRDDRAPRIVFLAVGNGVTEASVYVGRGAGVLAAVADAERQSAAGSGESGEGGRARQSRQSGQAGQAGDGERGEGGGAVPWRRLDVVATVTAVPPEERATTRLRLRHRIEGIAFAAPSGVALSPGELVGQRLIDAAGILDWMRVLPYLRGREAGGVARQLRPAYRFTTVSAATDGARVVVLERGLPPVRPEDPAALLDAARLGGRYLTAALDADGRFTYRYQADTGMVPSGYNIVRHAGTVYSLLELYEATKDAQTLAAAERALDYLLRQVRAIDPPKRVTRGTGVTPPEPVQPMNPMAPDDAERPAGIENAGNPVPAMAQEAEGGCAGVVEGGEVKLGGNALAVVALAKHAAVTGRRQHLPTAVALTRWILAAQDPDGRFAIHQQVYPDGRASGFESEYYPGEAILALVRMHTLMPEQGAPDWLDAAERGARWLITVRDGDAPDEALPHDHWLLYALNELHRLRPDPIFLAHTRRLARVIMASQHREPAIPEWRGGYYEPPRTTPTATRSEGLAAAYALLRDVGTPGAEPAQGSSGAARAQARGSGDADNDRDARVSPERGARAEAERILEALHLGTGFQLRTQLVAATTINLPQPGRALGGFHNSLADYEVRIDYVQHNISSLLALARILNEQGPLSGTEKGGPRAAGDPARSSVDK